MANRQYYCGKCRKAMKACQCEQFEFTEDAYVKSVPDPEEVKAIVREQAGRDALMTQEILTRIEHVHTRVLKRINQLRVFVYASAIIIMVMFLADIILDHGGF